MGRVRVSDNLVSLAAAALAIMGVVEVANGQPSPYPSTGMPAVAAPTLLPPPPSDNALVGVAPVPVVATPIETAPPEAGAEAIADADSVLAEETAAPVYWYSPTYWFGPTPWDTGFELGINGSSGTSETLSLRTGGYVKRKTDRNKIDLSLYYNKTTADGEETQSNAILDARHDWLLGDSPWTLFVMSQTFYDEFQAFDYNLNVNTGIGYQVFDEEWVKLLTRFGAGASREFGGVDDEWTPEAQFGMDWEQKISETRKFYAKVDYFPEWEDFSSFRVLTDMGLEIELVQPANVSLKLSATDRYDSNPDGVRPHNTNYSVLLLWKR